MSPTEGIFEKKAKTRGMYAMGWDGPLGCDLGNPGQNMYMAGCPQARAKFWFCSLTASEDICYL